RLLRSYERKMRRGLEAISWLIHRINTNVLRDMFMSSIDMFDIRDGVVAILAGDFYEKRGLFSPLRRCQLAYGVLYGLSKVGLRLRGSRPDLAFHQHPLNRQGRTNRQRAPIVIARVAKRSSAGRRQPIVRNR